MSVQRKASHEVFCKEALRISGGVFIDCKYYGLFQPWEIKHARELVWQFQRNFPTLAREGKEDLLQECLIHWYFKKGHYDQSKLVACKTFMSQVIENKLKDILEVKERQKHKTIFKSVSIDDLLNGIDDDSYCQQLAIDDERFKSILKSDINLILLSALEKLSGRQQELCRLIREEGLSLNQVSKKLNIPRATLYDEVLRIREVFRKEGLKDYL